METLIVAVIIALVVGALVGLGIAKYLERKNASKIIQRAKKSAASILKEAKQEAEGIKKDKILQAKEKFIELKAEHGIRNPRYQVNSQRIRT